MNQWDLLRKAIVAVEDRRFYSHWGVDPVAILRCIVVNSRSGRYAQGGSTITQQLARTLYLTTKKKLWRKISEIVIALWIESQMMKGEILDRYVEVVYMGHRKDGSVIRGFEEGAEYHFGKRIQDCSIAEIAWLVGMLKGPNVYGPGTEKGRVRQAYVLSVIADKEFISGSEFKEALAEL